ILDSMPMIALGIIAIASVFIAGNSSSILPTLITFLLSLQRLAVRLKATSSTIVRFADNSGRMLRLEAILKVNDKEYELSGDNPFMGLKGNIKFQEVSLSYGKNDLFELKNLNFSIAYKKVTALVGESGAGKSSILDLILGLYQPSKGRILINNKPLCSFKIVDLRQHIGMVSQDSFIFNDTIINNLRYGKPDASIDDIIFYAKAAQAHSFIVALPKGYETRVGERGYRLSGGQRQRLSFARAMIKDPDILILDEATSALDSESEKLIQDALEMFQKGRTVIIVAHRLSTVVKADQILVFERGILVDKGSHYDLINKKGPYERYWALQTLGSSSRE
ncbi:MAG: ATP-binding cassette domain-containing protein, partial [Balneolales bacterium]